MKYKNLDLKFKHLKVIQVNEALGYIAFICENKEKFILDLDTNTVKFQGYNSVKTEALVELGAWVEKLTQVSHLGNMSMVA